MLKTYLERSARFFRLGNLAEGMVALQAYSEDKMRKTDAFLAELNVALDRGDYLAAADILEYELIPHL